MTTSNQRLPIDQGLVGHEFAPMRWSWSERDTILYALGVGARVDSDFDCLYEARGPAVLPTFSVIPATMFLGQSLETLDFDFAKLLHGEQAIELVRPIPPSAEVTTTRRVLNVWDKGKAAVIEWEYASSDADGPVFTTRASSYIRDAGGFGGERGPSASDRNRPPAREPDRVLEESTWAEQPALYRLSGDFNPIHIDPQFARESGYERPFLHGLCTFGIVGRALVHALCGGDPTRLRALEARFTSLVFPGEVLRTELWLDGEGEAIVQTSTERAVVLGQGRVRFDADL